MGILMNVVQGVIMVRHSQPMPQRVYPINLTRPSCLYQKVHMKSIGYPAIKLATNRVCPTRSSFLFHEALNELGMV